MIGTYLVHGWMQFFMVQVDYRLFGTSWCMIDALVHGTGSGMILWAKFHSWSNFPWFFPKQYSLF
jgi:hypothetical protein